VIKSLARAVVAKLVRRFDYRLVDVRADPLGLAAVCAQLKRRGFHPRTVIDVGVGTGTPWLYAAFPNARFELFEPIESFRPAIEQSTVGLDVATHFCALGERPSRALIEIDPAHPTSSTMAHYSDRYATASTDGVPRSAPVSTEVDVLTLDQFAPFKGPTLLKLDVEGYEAQVVKGATRTLQEVDVVITEVSVTRRTETELSLSSFLALMESFGFSLMNIAEITQIGRGGPIAYMDVVMVRTDSPMRYGDT
jgi:FkbM family methyltransferase